MSNSALYNRITEYLKELIEKNCDIPNFKFPSERNLALKFNASIKPVRKAYQNLIDCGYVKSVHGKGYFITNEFKGTPALNPKNICFITSYMETNYIKQIRKGMQDFCEKQTLNFLIMISENNIKKEKRLLQSLPLSNTKGVIIYPTDNKFCNGELLRLSLGKFPIVIIDRHFKDVNFAYVATDNYNAAIDAVKFLNKKKYRNIALFTLPPTSSTSVEERILGYKHGIYKYYGSDKNNGILQFKPNDPSAQRKAIINYLQNFPDTEVIITTGGANAAGAIISAAAELNIPIPEKLKLMTFDNELSETETAVIRPYIIQQDGYNIGYEAAAALYNQIYGDLRIITKRLPVKIIDCSVTPRPDGPAKSKAARGPKRKPASGKKTENI